jgi:hypothetical protein
MIDEKGVIVKQHYHCTKPIFEEEYSGNRVIGHKPHFYERATIIRGEKGYGDSYVTVWTGSGAYGRHSTPDFETLIKSLTEHYDSVELVGITVHTTYEQPIKIK